ncbi:MAG TPA: endonuclease III domain-containing protein [Candidatus Paceibacterota bacterium]|nr:endonuclease III domain-containing protein [Verrucomicrobiota bacterium]HRY48937.1 endonuclease III domain-containing protein [Candidatus Paceibacterota bacterium]HSA01791.1 endonuclease III domain-containing protein [Candidatus Paceibacterota bacterium]
MSNRSIEWALNEAYTLMREHYGHQHWWPGETAFEVCVGAVLTQNTNWGNVERAIHNLKAAGVLSPVALYGLPLDRLSALIRPAGYFNVKAVRLRNFLRLVVEECGGSLESLFAGGTCDARTRLLAISGIGPETADSMLLYAGHHASFVVDAYTRRIFHRHGWCPEEISYEGLQELCAGHLRIPPNGDLLDYWQDYHAQLVSVGKDHCRSRQPRCDQCPLRPLLHGKKSGIASSRGLC